MDQRTIRAYLRRTYDTSMPSGLDDSQSISWPLVPVKAAKPIPSGNDGCLGSLSLYG